MSVHTTFFGDDNYMWASAKAEGVVLTVMDEDLFSFWEGDDRSGFVEHAAQHKFTRTQVRPAPNVASRWFNYISNVMDSAGDVWLHYNENSLWWTITEAKPGTSVENGPRSPRDRGIPVRVIKKPARPWTNLNKKGNRLDWGGIHAKAKDFLLPQSTQAMLNPDNAAYAVALINGEDLAPWHSRQEWIAKISGASSRQPATVYSDRQKSIYEMVSQVTHTTTYSNGQEVTRTVKNKEMRTSELELKNYVTRLLEEQEDRCAISDLPLQFRGSHSDEQMLCSLDHKDSNGHYELGNLQVVCRFINRWKSDSLDSEFKRLLAILRQ